MAYAPKLQFAPNMAVMVEFPFGDFRLIDSQTEDWDPSYMYTTTVAGTRHTLFASAGLHDALQEFGIRAKSTVEITKLTVPQDDGQYVTRWQVLDAPAAELGALLPEMAPETAPEMGNGPAQASTPTAGPTPHDEATGTFQACARHLLRCLAQAQKSYKDLGYGPDNPMPPELERLAVTLFIETCRKIDLGVLPPPPAEPVAAVNPPPPPPPPPAPPADNHPDDLPF